MTEDSGIRGAPLPREDLQFPSVEEPFENNQFLVQTNTRFGTWQEYAEFYRDFLTDAGWTFLPLASSTNGADADPGEVMVWTHDYQQHNLVVALSSQRAGTDDEYVTISLHSEGEPQGPLNGDVNGCPHCGG